MSEMNYLPEEALKIIKNAYDETGSDKFQNNLVESISPEVKQVIITTKEFFTFDKDAVKVLLEAEFPKNNYTISMFDDQIVITKTTGTGYRFGRKSAVIMVLFFLLTLCIKYISFRKPKTKTEKNENINWIYRTCTATSSVGVYSMESN